MRYIIIILLTTCWGCKKYLSQKPDAVQAVPTTLADLQALLDNAQYMNEQRTPSYMEASADDYFLSYDRYQSRFETEQEIYRWQRRPYRYGNDWANNYLPVYYANFCLEGLTELSSADRMSASGKRVEGSAHFFRAYYFLQLLWQHAKAYDESTSSTDFGIPLRRSTDFNIPSIRNTVDEGYNQVIADAHAAAALLTPLPEVTTYRPSRAAAFGLLARAYLSMRIYDSALYYAEQALSIKNELMDYNNELPGRFNRETIFYTEMSQLISTHMGYKSFIDTVITRSFLPDDLRLVKGFSASGNYHTFTGNYTGDQYLLFTGIAVDELILVRAECEARAGHIDAAMETVNHLLQKRYHNGNPYVPVSAGNAEEALQIILLERRKELLMRGLRWIDIKRLNAEGREISLKRIIGSDTVTLNPNSPAFALPLPQDIIEATGMPQN